MAKENSNIGTLLSFVIIIISTIIIVAGATNWKKHNVISNIQVLGNNLLSSEEVVILSGIKTPANMFTKNLDELRFKILSEPYINNVILQRDFPSRLIINIEERNPIAIISNSFGKTNYIDKNGFVLRLRNFKTTLDLPVIFTNVNYDENNFIRKEEVQLPLYTLQLIKEIDTTFYKNVSEIKLTSRNLILKTTEHGLPIILSKSEIEESVIKLSGFFNTYKEHLFETNNGFIDARFSDQIIVSQNPIMIN
ncbi:MAG: FtsQ-type POTRA domain-containing protein [Bacteroidetes bacterium]|nr:FtsQ-type POTRA domain-containing protein [Bacteroidota bacterium]